MRKKHYIVIALLLLPLSGFADDSRSTPPGWNWDVKDFTLDFKVDTKGCTNIRVPVGGEEVSGSASGESCPANMVAHGFYFGKKSTAEKTTPKYAGTQECQSRWPSGSNCPSWSATVTNPDTGKDYPKYDVYDTFQVAEEKYPGGPKYLATHWRYHTASGWNTKTVYTVDQNKIYMRCCPADI